MYARVVIMTVKDINDQNPQSILKNFADALYYHPMFIPIMDELKARDGYYERVHALIDNINGVKYISQFVFSNKETLEKYINDETTINLWAFILQMADQDGINIEVVDTENFLKF
jgi:hypothetical protein